MKPDINHRRFLQKSLVGAAAVAHMVNESIRRQAPVSWDFESVVIRRA